MILSWYTGNRLALRALLLLVASDAGVALAGRPWVGASSASPITEAAPGSWQAEMRESQDNFRLALDRHQEGERIAREAWREHVRDDPSRAHEEIALYHEAWPGFPPREHPAAQPRWDNQWEAHVHLLRSVACGAAAIKMKCRGEGVRGRGEIGNRQREWHQQEAERHVDKIRRIYRDRVHPAFEQARALEASRGHTGGSRSPNPPFAAHAHEEMAMAIDEARLSASAAMRHGVASGLSFSEAEEPVGRVLATVRRDREGKKLAPYSRWHRDWRVNTSPDGFGSPEGTEWH